MLSFAEWQAQQGGASSAAPPTAGGTPPAASPSQAPYDWLQAYEAATSNTYGDQSQDVLKRVIAEAGPDYQKAKDAGIIGPDGLVDWSKAPKPVANPSGNTMTASVGGRSGFTDPWSGKPTTSISGSYINDPNYGVQALVQRRAPNSPEMNLLKAGAISMAAMPLAGMLAPAISSGLGVGSTASNLLANTAIGAGKTLLQGGRIDPLAMAGGALGGLSGIPMGSTLGSTAGRMLGGKSPGITPTSAGMTFASWLANQAMQGGR